MKLNWKHVEVIRNNQGEFNYYFWNSFKKIKAAGVHILITEWDISILPSSYDGANVSASFAYSKEMNPYRDGVPYSREQKWNKRVLDMFGLFLKYNDVVDMVTVLGLNDAGT